ncbi:MAG: arginine--tRNA ligase [Nanobdellota archaeon]
MKEFKEQLINNLKEYIPQISPEQIEIPPDSSMGDFAYPCFQLSKIKKKPPAKIAEELKENIIIRKPFLKVENKGPYLNFFIEPACLAKEVLCNEKAIKKTDKPLNIMIEYSSPNTNKPLHLGHLRNIILGSTVSTIERTLGNNVTESCLINDRGIHICKSMLMYIKYGKNEPNKKPDFFVGDFYVMFNKEVQNNPQLEDEAQELLRRWEANDPEVVQIWEKMNKWAIEGFEQTYKTLGINFDKFYYESEIYKSGKDIVKKGLQENKLQKEDGAIIADMQDENLGKKVLIRSDNTSIYMTQDIYLAKKKFEDYNLDKSVYVVGSEQERHFKQLFKILEMLGLGSSEKCYHLSYGMVYLPEGKMKSREGNVVDADNLIEEVLSLAKEQIKKRHSITTEELEKRTRVIGIGALRFLLLKTDPTKDIIYDPAQSVSFEGETGPYVQYVYARISSIIRKADCELKNIDYDCYNKEENNLIKQLGRFNEIVQDAKKHYRPSMICRYLLDLCQEFNEYYHKIPILTAQEETKKARLLLIDKIRETIQKGLALLKIEVLEEM